MCQKLDLIETEVKHDNLKCMGIMQDDLSHPYILSIAVLMCCFLQMFQKKKQNNHLLSSVTMEAPPHIQRMLTSTQLALDMLCPILEIITPSFRPVSLCV